MFDSPRPVRTMTAAPCCHRPSPGTAVLRRLLSLARSAVTAPLALAAVALSATTLPAYAAHRTTSHAPVHSATRPVHAVASRSLSAHTGSARAASAHAGSMRSVAHAIPSGQRAAALPRGRRVAAAEEPAAPTRRGRVAARPLSRRERVELAAEERAEQHAAALAALHDRSNRYRDRHAASHDVTSQLAAAPLRRTTGHPPAVDTEETAADAHTEDRVHAWYRNRGAATAAPTTTARLNTAVQPDLSPVPHKATAADFARAAASQREAIQAAHDQGAHQTTADDDNADAETRIPSTAPTEREPAPFTHGSFGVGDTTSGSTGDNSANHLQGRAAGLGVPRSSSGVTANRSSAVAGNFNPPAANTSTGDGALIVRQPPAAIALAPPEHVDLKHRGDGLSTALAADAATQAFGPASAQVGVQTSTPKGPNIAASNNASSQNLRALAEETVNSPTPRLKLPVPPAAALHKPLPAVAAVQQSARHRDLDPAVSAGMADETFDEDSTPATARTAAALIAAGPANSVPGGSRPHTAVADPALVPATTLPVNLFDRSGHLVLLPPMKGSHEILVHQNQMAVSDGLDRIRDDWDLRSLRERMLLVALPDEQSTYPDDRLPANRRYARPWTVRFLRDLALAHYTRFGTPLIVTSAARTVEFQRHLVRVNGNAAPPTGDIASPHLYGQAIDIGKRGMGITELTWMRAYLTPVESDGKIDVEEEFQQSCFHISVYRRYLGVGAPRPAQPAPALVVPLLTAQTPAPAAEPAKPEKHRHRISTAMLATGLR